MNPSEALWFEHQRVGIWDVTEEGIVQRLKQRANNPLGWVDVDPTPIGHPNNFGYPCVGFYYNGRFHLCCVHRLVYLKYVGPILDGYEIDHIDYDKTNNKVTNLRAVTPKENKAHSEQHRLAATPRGRTHWNAKLDENKVRLIREYYEVGVPVKRIAEMMGVNVRHVYSVLEGKSWAHVPNDVTPKDGESS